MYSFYTLANIDNAKYFDSAFVENVSYIVNVLQKLHVSYLTRTG